MNPTSAFWRFHVNRKVARSAALCGLLLMLGANPDASATNFFTWGADSATTSAGTCNFVEAAIDPTGGHDGSGALKYTIPDGADRGAGCNDLNGGDIGAGSWTSGKTIYYRWWMKIDSAFNWGDRQIFKLARLEDGGGDLLTFYMNNDNVNVESSVGGAISCPGGVCGRINYLFTGAAAKNYQEYILALKLQSSASGTGTLTLFVNGVQVGSFTHQLYDCSTGCGNVQAASWGEAMGQALYHQLCLSGTACGAGGVIWVDDFSVDDSWNSLVKGSPGTGIPAPQNLQVK